MNLHPVHMENMLYLLYVIGFEIDSSNCEYFKIVTFLSFVFMLVVFVILVVLRSQVISKWLLTVKLCCHILSIMIVREKMSIHKHLQTRNFLHVTFQSQKCVIQ